MGNLEHAVELVTPNVARTYLAANRGNRKVRVNQVRSLADAIKRGEWRLTHQGIAFSSSGRLLDGQHRLNACIEAQTPILLSVVRGLPDDAFMALDIGNRRTTSDVLGADQRLVEVASLCNFLMTKNTRATPDQVGHWIDRIAAAHAYLVEGRGIGARRIISTAGMRLAAILSIADGRDREYVRNMYRALLDMDMDALPPCGRSLVAQIASETFGGRGTGRATSLEALARGAVVFDPAKSDLRRVLVKDRNTSMEWARGVLTRMEAA